MSCAAVFVDAGYLFAQGSAALTGSKKTRAELKLNETAVVSELMSVAKKQADTNRILRIYWYDATHQSKGISLEHSTLAHTDYIKLRLGQLNNQGEQKGVDSLIVTDMIELARNHAISDAVLLSGDEDVRIGVQIAQSFGVRIHLLGITPCRGSQSLLLMQEADTTQEWDATTVAKFLSHHTPISKVISGIATPLNALPPENIEAHLETVAMALFADIGSADLVALNTYRVTHKGLPSDIDGKLLAQARTKLGHNLDQKQRQYLRGFFIRLLPKLAT